MNVPRPIHPFPARMAASIPWTIFENASRKRSFRVLDPMAGSGTTLVIARRFGHQAIGFDADPLAVLIASAWCADVDVSAVQKATAFVSCRSKQLWRTIPQGDAYPDEADPETCEFIRYWFDVRSRRQLAALARVISAFRPLEVQRLLWCGFSRLIIVKQAGASLAMDVSHSRPHRKYVRAPIDAVEAFPRAMQRVIDASPFKKYGRSEYPEAEINMGDARRLRLDDASVDLVITSPPYLNAIDYLRGHKLSLVWMKHSVRELRDVRQASIGTEARVTRSLTDEALVNGAFEAALSGQSLPKAQMRMLKQYLDDMHVVLSEIRRVLKQNGQAALVIGDCMVRGTFVRNSNAIRYLAAHAGLTLLSRRSRLLPPNRRYLPPPQSKDAGDTLARRMRREVLLRFAVA